MGSASRRLSHLLAETRRREADATLLYQVGERFRIDADRVLVLQGVLDAVTCDRPYRSGMRADLARERLLTGMGSQFWPPAVVALVALLDAGDLPGLKRPDTALAAAAR